MATKRYGKCPYCQTEVSTNGSSMHVRAKHPDKYEEFRSGFEDWKKSIAAGEGMSMASEVSEPAVSKPPFYQDWKPLEQLKSFYRKINQDWKPLEQLKSWYTKIRVKVSNIKL